ncbi:BspA family leucine-rich repeat surface protein [Zobellia nedashkovskayae]|uniref:BspA family leucine-rich repeat surface protein n=1 Tax=Zobellia nedashkovskayae TaxID=2779510 RepID=UPI00188AE96F|nr:BspA family leucine-rich repeat surface protein [Zobellia nedashkovskayae]
MNQVTFLTLFSILFLFSSPKEAKYSSHTDAIKVSAALADAIHYDEGSFNNMEMVHSHTIINLDQLNPNNQRPFITTWKTDNPGPSNDDQITIPTAPGETYAYTVDWGDGSSDSDVMGDITHTYTTAGTYTVSVSGVFPRIFFETAAADKDKLLSIEQWGDNPWVSMRGAFYGCSNLRGQFSDSPDLTNVTNMQQMFLGARIFNSNIGDWDVSNVTNMRGLFQNATSFNQYIGDWDVSNVTNMSSLFFNTRVFNQDIGKWDVSSVTNMSSMFRATATFNQDLGDWDFSSVLSMPNMFNGALEFNQDIGSWNVDGVYNMSFMFLNAYSFNRNVENYDALLNGWSSLSSLQSGVSFDGGGSQYCQSTAGRQKLIDDYGWVITDGGRSEDCVTESGGRPFVTTWKTDNPGTSSDNQITIPTFPGETYDYNVDWGDSSSDNGVTGDITHTYVSPGTYTVSISGTFPRIYFNQLDLGPQGPAPIGDARKIITIEQWGDNSWTSMNEAFAGCRLLQGNFTDAPDLTNVTNMSNMFNDARIFNHPIGDWDVSNVTDMSGLLNEVFDFNQPIGDWDVSNVTSMQYMFGSDGAFNQDIGSWDVGNVTNMAGMFSASSDFNQDIGSWDVGNVTDMAGMFANALLFNQDIGGWDVSNVTDMSNMFFYGAPPILNVPGFNQDISAWDVGNVKNMAGMFESTGFFNQDIGNWNVSNVENMQDMFKRTEVFNQDIGGWEVGNVKNMVSMFSLAKSFDKDIGNWNVGNVETMFRMFEDSNLSIENYDATLNGWSTQQLQNGVTFDGGDSQYCDAEAARQRLIDDYGWVITDGGRLKDCGTEGGDRFFVTTWKTNNTGTSADNQITIPTFPGETYEYTVDWGDGNTDTAVSGNITHTYATSETYTVSISGVFPRIYFETAGDKDKLLSIEQWGDNPWVSMRGAFAGCSNLQGNFSDSPDLSNVTNMRRMFNGATSFNHPIENWDVSSIKDMSSSFRDASSFNQDIGDWDVSNVTEMSRMFYQATSFNGFIGSWDVGNVIDMSRMFFRASTFNQDIASWDVSSVKDMSSMFEGPVIFNQEIGDWDVSQVTVMTKMFHNTLAFNQDIGGWDVSNLQDMDAMFYNALAFNQNIGDWNVGQVTTMQNMFNGAKILDQNLGAWDVGRVTDMENMFNRVDLSIENYDAILNGWGSLSSLQSNITLGVGTNTFCDGKVAKQRLTDSFGWVITDGGEDCSSITQFSTEVVKNEIPFDISIYPNPSSDMITISVDAPAEIKEIKVYDLAGRLVQTTNVFRRVPSNEYSLDVSYFNAGTYYIQATDSLGSVYQQQLLIN